MSWCARESSTMESIFLMMKNTCFFCTRNVLSTVEWLKLHVSCKSIFLISSMILTKILLLWRFRSSPHRTLNSRLFIALYIVALCILFWDFCRIKSDALNLSSSKPTCIYVNKRTPIQSQLITDARFFSLFCRCSIQSANNKNLSLPLHVARFQLYRIINFQPYLRSVID